jgi:hypothetical protein
LFPSTSLSQKNEQLKASLQDQRNKLEGKEMELGSTQLRCAELEEELKEQQVLFSNLNGHCIRLQRELDDLSMHANGGTNFGRKGSRDFLGSTTDASLLDEIAIEELKRERDEWRIRAVNAEGKIRGTPSGDSDRGNVFGNDVADDGAAEEIRRLQTPAAAKLDKAGARVHAEQQQEEETEALVLERQEVKRLAGMLEHERASMANERHALEARLEANDKTISLLHQQMTEEQRARIQMQGERAKLNNELVTTSVGVHHYLDQIAQLEDRVQVLERELGESERDRFAVIRSTEEGEMQWKVSAVQFFCFAITDDSFLMCPLPCLLSSPEPRDKLHAQDGRSPEGGRALAGADQGAHQDCHVAALCRQRCRSSAPAARPPASGSAARPAADQAGCIGGG